MTPGTNSPIDHAGTIARVIFEGSEIVITVHYHASVRSKYHTTIRSGINWLYAECLPTAHEMINEFKVPERRVEAIRDAVVRAKEVADRFQILGIKYEHRQILYSEIVSFEKASI